MVSSAASQFMPRKPDTGAFLPVDEPTNQPGEEQGRLQSTGYFYSRQLTGCTCLS